VVDVVRFCLAGLVVCSLLVIAGYILAFVGAILWALARPAKRVETIDEEWSFDPGALDRFLDELLASARPREGSPMLETAPPAPFPTNAKGGSVDAN
jgi:steroid 5-alpha reductase family enzyme